MRFATFRTIHPQEQVYLGYGAKSNADLLVYYGFAVEHNPYDVLELQVCAFWWDCVQNTNTVAYSRWCVTHSTCMFSNATRYHPPAKQRVVRQ